MAASGGEMGGDCMIDHFNLVQQALSQLDHSAVQRAIDIIKAAKQRGSMVFICGNGGSAATASHFACDLQKAAGVRAIALTDNVPLITAWANDSEYAEIFTEQFKMLNSATGDVLILVSCSGTSRNILRALGLGVGHHDVIAMYGFGRALYSSSYGGYDCLGLAVNSEDYGVIEDCHLAICHAITKGVRDE